VCGAAIEGGPDCWGEVNTWSGGQNCVGSYTRSALFFFCVTDFLVDGCFRLSFFSLYDGFCRRLGSLC